MEPEIKLNAITVGQNKYCGPAVLSILTGKSTDECASVISSINGKYNIEGVELKHLLEAASRLGFDNLPIAPANSLYGTLIRLVNSDGLYIVTVANHFVAIEVAHKKIYFCDNHTKEPMPAGASARLLQKVKAVNRVFKRREPVLMSSKYRGCTSHTVSGFSIEIYKEYIYDIEKHNKTVTVARLSFDTEEQIDEFLNTMKETH